MKNSNQVKCRSAGIPSACEVPEPSPIQGALQDIAARLDAVDGLIGLLGERLDPVLSAVGPSVSKDALPLEHGMVGQLRSIERRLADHVEALSDIRDRIVL